MLFTVIPSTSDPEQIAVASLKTAEHRVLLEGSHPRYVGTGHLFFRRGTTLWRVPFDAQDAQLAGEPVPVLEGVRAAPRSASFALGGNGSLAYFPEREQTESPRALVWVDRQGQEEELPLPPRSYVWPRVSPDGMHAAVWTIDSRDVWVTELERGTLSRLTTYEGNDTTPLWTPSGERVVFQSTRAPRGLYSKAADGTGTVELLLRANEDWAFMNPMSWSGDGRTLVFHYWSPDTAGDIGVLPMGGEREWEPLLETPAIELAPAVSQDGKWLAYLSDQTGQAEVYVERFPNLGDRRQISVDGGMGPQWSPDGRELFYRRLGDGALMVVSFDSASGAVRGRPEVVFDGRYFHALGGPFDNPGYIDYGIAPEGDRFLMLKDVASTTGASQERIVIVGNWLDELDRRPPAP